MTPGGVVTGRMFAMVAAQILAASARERAAQQAAIHNPKPPGTLLPGSSSDTVLRFLRANPGRWYSRGQIILCTRLANTQVNHALTFLVAQGRVRTAPDGARNARYLRYCFDGERA